LHARSATPRSRLPTGSRRPPRRRSRVGRLTSYGRADCAITAVKVGGEEIAALVHDAALLDDPAWWNRFVRQRRSCSRTSASRQRCGRSSVRFEHRGAESSLQPMRSAAAWSATCTTAQQRS
jgi:hypothetical protein